MSYMNLDLDEKIKDLAQLISKTSRIVLFTGAGISTESGIPDYRSQGGLWQKFQPVTLQEFIYDGDKRQEYWRRKKEMYAAIRAARPSAGHLAAAALAKKGKLLGIITQNIDGLHLKAGGAPVLELHGTNLEAICLNCSDKTPFEAAYKRLLDGEASPRCLKCEGLIKPNTISFGQALDPGVLHQALDWVQTCKLIICAGSTLVVEPAASLPRYAKSAGAKLVIINNEPTPLDGLADLCIRSQIGPVLSGAVNLAMI